MAAGEQSVNGPVTFEGGVTRYRTSQCSVSLSDRRRYVEVTLRFGGPKRQRGPIQGGKHHAIFA